MSVNHNSEDRIVLLTQLAVALKLAAQVTAQTLASDLFSVEKKRKTENSQVTVTVEEDTELLDTEEAVEPEEIVTPISAPSESVAVEPAPVVSEPPKPTKKPSTRKTAATKRAEEKKAKEVEISIDPALVQFHFGARQIPSLNDTTLLLQRMECNLGEQAEYGRFRVMDKYGVEDYGYVSAIQLQHVWRITHSKDAEEILKQREKARQKRKKRGLGLNDYEYDLDYRLSHTEWDHQCAKLSNFLSRRRDPRLLENPAVISELWPLKEIEFETLFLEKASNVIKLMQLALLADARQNAKLEKKWHKIKKYMYKVPLESKNGGVFSDEDSEVLRSFGIYNLNDIRYHSIYQLKNMLLEHEFSQIVEEINEAFAEDLRKRRDVRYKVWPFVFGFVSLAIVVFFCFNIRYDLIKDQTLTIVVMSLLTVWAITVPTILAAGARAPWRRKTKADYVYFTKAVKRTCVFFAICAILTASTVFFFYQRYDGYNKDYYYRDLENGTITIAGLRNEHLTHAEIPETIDGKLVTGVDITAFDQTDLKSVVFPSSMLTIGKGAFAHCTQLKEVTFNEGLVEIKKYAFYETDALTDVILPSTVTTLGEHLFENSGVKTVDISAISTDTLPKAIFKECTGINTFVGLEKLSYIGDEAFYHCSAIPALNFSEKLVEIGKAAFYQCSTLQEIVIPQSTERIGKNAFGLCKNITSMSVPFIGNNAHEDGNISNIISFDPDKSNVTVIVTGETVITGKHFKGCQWVQEIVLGDQVTEIQKGAFKNLTTLKTITIPETIKTIPEDAFNGCYSLKNLNGFDNITHVNSSAFEKCTSLQTIDLPALCYIGDHAFAQTAIEEINIPDAVTSISESAFESCLKLKDIKWSQNLVTIEKNAFRSCTALKEITFPEKLVTVGSRAFEGCTALRTINFAESMTDVHKRAFSNTAPKTVDLPENLIPLYKSMFDIDFETVITEAPTEAPTDAATGDDSGKSTAPADSVES